jgi:TP901 family phage tail tape measure protein
MAAKPIVVHIQGETSKLKKALGEAERGVKGFAKNVGALGIKAGAAFGAAATAVGITGVNAAADFEKSMKEVFTLLPDAGAETFKSLEDQVKNFSKEFGVLPNEVVPSLYQAISAGVPVDNVFTFLETAQQAAKGGVTDLETAVDGISSVVNSYGEEVITASEASDLLFTAVKLGKTDFEQLSGSIFQVAPIAAALGVDFEAVTAAMANLTAQGTPTSVAATQLKGAFSELGKEGTKADTAFREIAGMSFPQFIASGGDVHEAFMLLAQGAADSDQSVLDLFGSIEAGQAVLGLTSDGGEAFATTMGEMENSAGATETAFNTMNTGMAADFEKVKANMEVLKIEIGQKLAPIVLKATNFLISNMGNFKDIAEDVRAKVVEIAKKAFPIFVKIVKTAIKIFKDRLMPVFRDTWKVMKRIGEFVVDNKEKFIALTAALGGAFAAFKLLQGFKALITFLKSIKAAVLGMNAAMAANPIGLVVVALGALVGALIYAYTESETFRETVHKIIDTLQDHLMPAFNLMKEVAEVTIDAIVVLFEFLYDQIKLAIDLVKAIFKGDFGEAFSILGDMAENSLNLLLDAFLFFPRKILDAVLPKLKSALDTLILDPFNSFKDLASGVVDDVLGFFKELPRKLTNLVNDFILAGFDLAKGLMDGMVAGIKKAAGWTLGLAKDIINAITGFINVNLIDPFNDLLEFKIPIPFAPDIHVNPPDIPHIPELAKGGIVQGRQLALLGDNPSGTEAVIPLEKAGQMGFGGTTINLTVNAGMGADGTQIGSQILSFLKQWERTNGALPLSVSS